MRRSKRTGATRREEAVVGVGWSGVALAVVDSTGYRCGVVAWQELKMREARPKQLTGEGTADVGRTDDDGWRGAGSMDAVADSIWEFEVGASESAG